MKKYYDEFNKLLKQEDRYGCINYVKELLDNKKINIIELYEEILGPSMVEVGYDILDEDIRIWQEHVYASIVRSVVENCYPYVVLSSKEYFNTKNVDKKVMVLCPSEEYHEIGPRMVEDFFTLLGFQTTYIGSNVPKEDFILAVKNINPDVIAISVSSYYNIVAAAKTIELLKTVPNNNFKIIVGGIAFENNKGSYKQIGANYQVKTFNDIVKISGDL